MRPSVQDNQVHDQEGLLMLPGVTDSPEAYGKSNMGNDTARGVSEIGKFRGKHLEDTIPARECRCVQVNKMIGGINPSI